jgi:hypothetical protein
VGQKKLISNIKVDSIFREGGNEDDGRCYQTDSTPGEAHATIKPSEQIPSEASTEDREACSFSGGLFAMGMPI